MVCMATEDDLNANAEYIRLADEFIVVESGSNRNNYANVDLIVKVARRCGADAVWPGWGHASENPKLPSALAYHDIAFLGPSAAAMDAVGDKICANILAQSCDVDVIPWSGSGLTVDGTTIPEQTLRAATLRTVEEGTYRRVSPNPASAFAYTRLTLSFTITAAPGTYFETETETERRRVDSIFLRKRLGFRFLRRAFLAKRLECLVTAADLNVDRARAAAQARDVTNPDSKPKRAMHKAPELLQHAYRAATGDAKQARATRRDETPSGVRVLGSGGSLLSNVLPKLHSKTNGPLAAHAVRDLLRDAVANTQHRACRLVEEIGTLAPYMRALAAAGVNGVDQTSLDHASVKQSGFGLVDDIATGKTPQCCICCAPATQPTIARCMHLACARCMVTWCVVYFPTPNPIPSFDAPFVTISCALRTSQVPCLRNTSHEHGPKDC